MHAVGHIDRQRVSGRPDLSPGRHHSIITETPHTMDAMADTLPIRCKCGTVRALADIRDHHARRAVCYCRDCRMFAYFLAQADKILDRHGGTEVVQMSQARLRFEAGRERLACLRLTPRGLLRWYAACCDTPIGNVTANRHIPYLGLVHACLDYGATGSTPESLLGPIDCRVHAHDPEVRQRYTDAHAGIPVGTLVRVASRVLGWRLRGDHRQSPFFDPDSGAPIVQPRVLSAKERASLAAQV